VSSGVSVVVVLLSSGVAAVSVTVLDGLTVEVDVGVSVAVLVETSWTVSSLVSLGEDVPPSVFAFVVSESVVEPSVAI
jgi:hypothetical protein